MPRRVRPRGVIALFWVLASCGADPAGDTSGDASGDGSAPDSAVDAGPCEAPRALCAGACVNLLTDTRHCGRCGNGCLAGEVCAGATCAETNPTRNLSIGARCQARTDCGEGGLCLPDTWGFPQGYCIYGCARQADCGAAGACAHSEDADVCLLRCARSADCRAGYVCAPLNPGEPSVCLNDCARDPGLVCGPDRCLATGRCGRDCRAAGDCAAGSQCTGGRCRCTARTACGPYRSCNTATGACACTDNRACAPARCDTNTGRCRGL
ncbi:MAG: hypothetical protein HY909_16780 [Deltaproteobacteria bacterium]|nr:hypothetical protein [Deltaproteobacteria bacterium]